MKCINCKKSVKDDAKFCPYCGAHLFKNCINCNAEMPLSDRFCSKCGTDNFDNYCLQVKNHKYNLKKIIKKLFSIIKISIVICIDILICLLLPVCFILFPYAEYTNSYHLKDLSEKGFNRLLIILVVIRIVIAFIRKKKKTKKIVNTNKNEEFSNCDLSKENVHHSIELTEKDSKDSIIETKVQEIRPLKINIILLLILVLYILFIIMCYFQSEIKYDSHYHWYYPFKKESHSFVRIDSNKESGVNLYKCSKCPVTYQELVSKETDLVSDDNNCIELDSTGRYIF